MEPEDAQAESERDQLWAALRTLRPLIEQLARGEFDGSEAQGRAVQLLARIVAAELDYRAQGGP
jgi:hypothetical protein